MGRGTLASLPPPHSSTSDSQQHQAMPSSRRALLPCGPLSASFAQVSPASHLLASFPKLRNPASLICPGNPRASSLEMVPLLWRTWK